MMIQCKMLHVKKEVADGDMAIAADLTARDISLQYVAVNDVQTVVVSVIHVVRGFLAAFRKL